MQHTCPHVLHSAAQLTLSGPGAGRAVRLTPGAMQKRGTGRQGGTADGLHMIPLGG